MADESKLKAQAREFLIEQGCSPALSRKRHEAIWLMTAFARQVADEQVKAETADLRDRLADAEAVIDHYLAYEFDQYGFDKATDYRVKYPVELQENK